MGKPAIIAVVQIQWQRYGSESALRDEFVRFLRLARNKNADVVLFPELAGLLLAGPLARDKQDTLKKRGGFFERLRNSLSGTPELTKVLPTLVDEYSEELTERYTRFFGDLASEYRLLLIAGTLLGKDEDGITRYRTGVFDADGSLLGWQNKLHLSPEEEAIATPGETVEVFEGPFGRFGVLPGHDLLFPELARTLAYRGCVALFNATRAHSRDSWQRQRLIGAARAQENQLFVAQSYLLGEPAFVGGKNTSLVGRSAVLAPVELSPRGDGILAEIGAEKVEGVVSGEWNPDALRNLWASAEIPLRSMVRGTLYHDLLAFDHQSGSTIAERTEDIEAVAALHQQPAAPTETPPAEPAPATQADGSGEEAAEKEESGPPASPEPADNEGQAAADEPGEPAVQTPSPAMESGATSHASPSPSRYIPVIDPETGRYLGEKRVEEE